MIASYGGHLHVVKTLIEAEANVNQISKVWFYSNTCVCACAL